MELFDFSCILVVVQVLRPQLGRSFSLSRQKVSESQQSSRWHLQGHKLAPILLFLDVHKYSFAVIQPIYDHGHIFQVSVNDDFLIRFETILK